MFKRKKNATLHGNVNDFADQAGVTFCIHVFYTTADGAQILALAPPFNKRSLLGVPSNRHPDQLYLGQVTREKLALLADKTITRIEVDDTISFCGTGHGQCGKVVPAWVKEQFPDSPALLFIHKSDRPGHTLGGKHVYDLYDPETNESWDWTDDDQSASIGGVPLIRYVALYTCKTVRCRNKGTLLPLVEVKGAAQKGEGGFAMIPLARSKCNLCNRPYDYHSTRIKRGNDEPIVLLY